MENNPKKKLFIIILLIAGFLCYINALPNNFVWDDEEQIVNNVFIRQWRNFPSIFTSSTFYGGYEKPWGGFYRPWVTLSYMLNYTLWGLKPFGYHLFQIFFHLANIILVFFVLRKIFSTQNIQHSEEISFLAALLFAVHPVNTESVGYIASIGEVLYVFFGLIAMLFFLRGVNYQTKNIKNSAFFLTLFLIFLGLFAKESIVVILPLLFLYLLFFVRPNFKTYLKYIFGSVLVVWFYLFLKSDLAKLGTKFQFASLIGRASLLEKLLTVPREILSYFLIIFFPKNLYVSRHFITTSISNIQFWGALLIILAVLIVFVFFAKKRNFLLSLFFALWFFGSIALVLNILIPLEMTIAERWLYFPIIGVLALVSYALFQLANNIRGQWQKKLFFGLIILIVLALAGRTIIRLSDWRNGLTLYSHDIKLSKNSYDAENNYGVELYRVERFDEAKLRFQRSIEIQDKWFISHNNLGASYEKEGNFEMALLEYQRSMQLSDYYLAYENMAELLLRLNKEKEAKDFLEKAIVKFPSHSKLKLIMAILYYKNKEISKAIEIVQSVLRAEPNNILAKNLLFNLQKGVEIY